MVEVQRSSLVPWNWMNSPSEWGLDTESRAFFQNWKSWWEGSSKGGREAFHKIGEEFLKPNDESISVLLKQLNIENWVLDLMIKNYLVMFFSILGIEPITTWAMPPCPFCLYYVFEMGSQYLFLDWPRSWDSPSFTSKAAGITGTMSSCVFPSW
jgi:hypothetical protein